MRYTARAKQRDGLHMRPRQSLPRPYEWQPRRSMEASSFRRRDSNGILSRVPAQLADLDFGLKDVVGHSFKKNLLPYSLIFVIEKMAVKDGHALMTGR